ncbi:MAG TPA: M48 family metallopeptidase [Candidatus Enterousia avicola]|uniref:M48 family metallopeptidase n=1 Tax=Candidatus Enterousia avicola TaxID=2840787 RepID=A0A9D1SMX2_9PROT|nr:M48 family metallopeptidase [Candidatus Enterousia avicola]
MNKVKTVYDHIKSNNIKTFLLVLLFPLIFIALIFLFTWFVVPAEQALQTTIGVAIPTFIACIVWLLISWAFGDSMMLNSAHAHEIYDSDPKNREIFRSVENVAIAAGLPCPRVYIIDDDSMNAFATGRSPKDASVALTRGIIKKLDKLELEGVIAHEMAHIGNRDIRLDMMLITGVGVTVFAADIIFRLALSSDKSSDNKNNSAAILMMVWLAFMVFNWIITPLLRMAVSRNREYAADATGAQITRNPRALASALRKITTDSRVECLDKVKSMAAVCIANPSGPREFVSSLMATHPPVEKRIERLESMG